MLQVQSVEAVARLCHEVNRVYCESIGDGYHQLSWENAPDWQKESAINGVKVLLADPSKTPEQMHTNWMREKLAAGWTHGMTKDAQRKTHPCIVAYNDLPPEQRIKDTLFRCTALAAIAVGL